MVPPSQSMMSVSEAFEAGRDLKVLLKRVLQQVTKGTKQRHQGRGEPKVDLTT
jgi:hypothetical protein